MRRHRVTFWILEGSRAKIRVANRPRPQPGEPPWIFSSSPCSGKTSCPVSPPGCTNATPSASASCSLAPLRQGPPHRHQWAPRLRRRPRLRRLLLLPRHSGPPGRDVGRSAAPAHPPPASPPPARCCSPWTIPPPSVTATTSRGRDASQPDPGPDRPTLPVWPRLGLPRLGGPPSSLGGPRSAPAPCWTSARKTCPASPSDNAGRCAPRWRWRPSWSLGRPPGSASWAGRCAWLSMVSTPSGRSSRRRPGPGSRSSVGCEDAAPAHAAAASARGPPAPGPAGAVGVRRISLAKRVGQGRGWQQVECGSTAKCGPRRSRPSWPRGDQPGA